MGYIIYEILSSATRRAKRQNEVLNDGSEVQTLETEVRKCVVIFSKQIIQTSYCMDKMLMYTCAMNRIDQKAHAI